MIFSAQIFRNILQSAKRKDGDWWFSINLNLKHRQIQLVYIYIKLSLVSLVFCQCVITVKKFTINMSRNIF